jgi:hypothetical protein
MLLLALLLPGLLFALLAILEWLERRLTRFDLPAVIDGWLAEDHPSSDRVERLVARACAPVVNSYWVTNGVARVRQSARGAAAR